LKADLAKREAELEDKDAELRRCPSSSVARLLMEDVLHSAYARAPFLVDSYARAPFWVGGTRTPSYAGTNHDVA
jgi:hypothetical protein